MPSSVLSTDTLFPELTDNTDVREYLEEVSDYLFLLKEQLGYSLHNLGLANFNTAQLAQMTKIIREPLYAQIQDTDDNVASLQLTAAGLISRMDNFGGASSTIEQTVGGISSTVSSLSSSVGTINSNYVSKTTATQTSFGFKLDVRSGANSTMVVLDKDGLTVHRGAIKIKNNYGTDVLKADEDGNLVMTGLISGARIYGSTISTANYDAPSSGYYLELSGNSLVARADEGVLHGWTLFNGAAPQLTMYNYGSLLMMLSIDRPTLTSYIQTDYQLDIVSGTVLRLNRPGSNGIIRLYGQVYVNDNLIS